MSPPPFVLLTELDGCLLDRRGQHTAAARALAALGSDRVPVVICSARSRAEIEPHLELGQGHPFAVENGAATFVPAGYFPFSHALTRTEGDFEVVEMGMRHAGVLEAFHEIRRVTRLALYGFSDMSVAEVAFYTGLGLREAARARAREYTETFVASLDADEEARLEAEARRRGLTLARGGRFFHLMGGHDKGLAAAFLVRLYRALWPGISVVATGRRADDLPLLLVADYPIVIPRESGVVDRALLHRNWPVAPCPGPEGWNASILRLLEQRARPVPMRPRPGPSSILSGLFQPTASDVAQR